MDATGYKATLMIQLRINRENLPTTANCHQEENMHNIMRVNNLLAGIQEPSKEVQISLAQSLQPLNSINFNQAPHFLNSALRCRQQIIKYAQTQELKFGSSPVTKTLAQQWRRCAVDCQQILTPWISGIVK